MQREKRGWGGCQTPPGSGEKQEGAASCLGATQAAWLPPGTWLRVRVPQNGGENEHPRGTGETEALCQALLSRNPFGRSMEPWLQEAPALWGAMPGVPWLRAPSSLVCLTDLRGQGKLAAGRAHLGALQSSPGQLQLLQVGVWDSLGLGAPEISPCAVGLTLAFPFPRAGRFFSWL